jgi:hypothetical protein
MKAGDKRKLDGKDITILEIKPRNEWAKLGRFEPTGIDLLGLGIIGEHEDGTKEYFYDFDLDD